MKFHGSGAASCRGYESGCLEDVGIDRSPNTGFLENCPGFLDMGVDGPSCDERRPYKILHEVEHTAATAPKVEFGVILFGSHRQGRGRRLPSLCIFDSPR